MKGRTESETKKNTETEIKLTQRDLTN